jgi:hypothetical protein
VTLQFFAKANIAFVPFRKIVDMWQLYAIAPPLLEFRERHIPALAEDYSASTLLLAIFSEPLLNRTRYMWLIFRSERNQFEKLATAAASVLQTSNTVTSLVSCKSSWKSSAQVAQLERCAVSFRANLCGDQCP